MLAAPVKNGIIFDVEKYAIHDGPGIRTTVFLKGCPLRCWWCQNPEGQDSKPELVFRKSRCIACNECIKACSRKAISPTSEQVSINRKKCVLCDNCSRACPSDALSIAGKQMSVKEVLEEIEKDAVFYSESGGGVTFSGGEPLKQPEFLNALVTECKKKGIHTTVETCGSAPYRVINRVRDKVDLFLYDVKIMDDRKHRKYTGASNVQILANLRKLAEDGGGIVIGFPIMPGINDDHENVTRTAEFIQSLPNVKRVKLLPYHRGGVEKYNSLGKPYKLGRVKPPSDERIGSIKRKIEAFGITVGVGGG